MKRNVKRHERKRRHDLIGSFIIVACFLVAIALIFVYVRTNATERKIDEQTLCPVDGADGLTVVLIDRTDPLSAIQREDLMRHLDQLKAALPIRTAIEVYSIGADQGDLLKPEGHRLCNAGRATDVDALTGNPRLTEKRWRERFSRPLDDLFERMTQSATSPRSPIMEAIQSVAVTAFGRLPERASYRRLVIVSDMLQNSDLLSQYGKLIAFDQFKQQNQYQRLRTDLKGVEVELWYIGGRSPLQGRQHIEFWQQYFANTGATLVRVSAIQG